MYSRYVFSTCYKQPATEKTVTVFSDFYFLRIVLNLLGTKIVVPPFSWSTWYTHSNAGYFLCLQWTAEGPNEVVRTLFWHTEEVVVPVLSKCWIGYVSASFVWNRTWNGKIYKG